MKPCHFFSRLLLQQTLRGQKQLLLKMCCYYSIITMLNVLQMTWAGQMQKTCSSSHHMPAGGGGGGITHARC